MSDRIASPSLQGRLGALALGGLLALSAAPTAAQEQGDLPPIGDPVANDAQTIILDGDPDQSRLPAGGVRPATDGLEAAGQGERSDAAPGPAETAPDARTILYVGDGPGRPIAVEGGDGGVVIGGEPVSAAERARLIAKDNLERGTVIGDPNRVKGRAPDTAVHVDNVIVTTGRGGESKNKACVRIGAVGGSTADCKGD